MLRSLCPTERGDCRPVRPESDFWAEFERELAAPLAQPAPAMTAPGSFADSPATVAGAGRVLRDRRGEGFAGVAGDLLSSGEPVAIVCADVERRRAGLEEVVGGIVRAVKARQ